MLKPKQTVPTGFFTVPPVGPAMPEMASAIVDLVSQARAEGEAFGRPFLNSCEAESKVYTPVGCECVAQIALIVLPDIYTRRYTNEFLNQIGRKNPALHINMMSFCGIGQLQR